MLSERLIDTTPPSYIHSILNSENLDQESWNSRSSVPVVRLDKVSESLWLLVTVVVMWVVRKTNVFHLVHTTALVTSLVWSLLGNL